MPRNTRKFASVPKLYPQFAPPTKRFSATFANLTASKSCILVLRSRTGLFVPFAPIPEVNNLYVVLQALYTGTWWSLSATRKLTRSFDWRLKIWGIVRCALVPGFSRSKFVVPMVSFLPMDAILSASRGFIGILKWLKWIYRDVWIVFLREKCFVLSWFFKIVLVLVFDVFTFEFFNKELWSSFRKYLNFRSRLPSMLSLN